MPAEAVVIFSTAGEEEAPSIAEILVKEHCAACVNITPVRSIYHWKGELCRDQELLMIIKTTRNRAGAAMVRRSGGDCALRAIDSSRIKLSKPVCSSGVSTNSQSMSTPS